MCSKPDFAFPSTDLERLSLQTLKIEGRNGQVLQVQARQMKSVPRGMLRHGFGAIQRTGRLGSKHRPDRDTVAHVSDRGPTLEIRLRL